MSGTSRREFFRFAGLVGAALAGWWKGLRRGAYGQVLAGVTVRSVAPGGEAGLVQCMHWCFPYRPSRVLVKRRVTPQTRGRLRPSSRQSVLVPLHGMALLASAKRSWSSSPCVRQALLRVQWRDHARE